MKTKRKSDPFSGCAKPVARLYRAVGEYVKSCGGKVIIIGGIQTQQWPGQSRFQFYIAVKCYGTMPKYKNPVHTRIEMAGNKTP